MAMPTQPEPVEHLPSTSPRSLRAMPVPGSQAQNDLAIRAGRLIGPLHRSIGDYSRSPHLSATDRSLLATAHKVAVLKVLQAHEGVLAPAEQEQNLVPGSLLLLSVTVGMPFRHIADLMEGAHSLESTSEVGPTIPDGLSKLQCDLTIHAATVVADKLVTGTAPDRQRAVLVALLWLDTLGQLDVAAAMPEGPLSNAVIDHALSVQRRLEQINPHRAGFDGQLRSLCESSDAIGEGLRRLHERHGLPMTTFWDQADARDQVNAVETAPALAAVPDLGGRQLSGPSL